MDWMPIMTGSTSIGLFGCVLSPNTMTSVRYCTSNVRVELAGNKTVARSFGTIEMRSWWSTDVRPTSGTVPS